MLEMLKNLYFTSNQILMLDEYCHSCIFFCLYAIVIVFIHIY